MDRYNPDIAPDAKAWLSLDEGERLSLIQRYHRKAKIDLPNIHVHAAFHAIVEGQLASRNPANVVATLERLMHEGLSRHDAIHAIAAVVSNYVFDVIKGNVQTPMDIAAYSRDLNKLTRESWYADYGEDEEDDDDGYEQEIDKSLPGGLR